MATSKPRLFIGSSVHSLPVANVLQYHLQHDADINVWNQGIFGVADYTLDRLLRATKEFDFAAFVFCADDTLKLKKKRYLVARDNVVLELGIFAGRLGRERAFIVLQKMSEDLHLPSDLLGITPAEFTWPADLDFESNYTKLTGALGPAAQDIRVAMESRGLEDLSLRPLSGGMVFIALWLTQRVYSLHELDGPFKRFMAISARLGPGDAPFAAKAAKYACQCLEALGMAESVGGNEYKITALGRDLLKSDKLRTPFANTVEIFERLKSEK